MSKALQEILGRNWSLFSKINRLSRRQARYAIAVITGHFGTGSMLLKMGIIDDPTCMACNEDVESTEHLLCECDGLARKRLDLLGVAYPQPEDYFQNKIFNQTLRVDF
ncbi:jg2251 [Pararge aegeria aegeria]|uniref:Jg2251 protein n=1 Tax=Pararge aegeria aegeria TaxID=348720 RepID=A0A8S4SM34_9NEOP|nr:jg2251 [Pararge aegeria aegeria]